VRSRIWRYGGLTAALTTAAVLAGTTTAWADSTGADFIPGTLEGTDVSLNLLWIVLGAVLVIFMQAGFALVETGFCRAKHAAHVVMTNFTVFGLGFVGYFLVGFGIMFGGYTATVGADAVPVIGTFTESIGNYIGNVDGFGAVFAWASPALSGNAYDVGVLAFFLYLVAFMDTVATIPTGAMAERWKFKSFVWWGLFCGAIYFPLFGLWTWGGGWLSQLGNNFDLGKGYVDFAGSGVVHAMGGVAALAGALILGPRIGKFGPDGKPRTLLGHHIPMAMLGTLILLFGWFGFNAASTFAVTDPRFTVVAANTGIAAAFGSVAGLFWVMLRTGKPDPGMAANGMLAGLVAITAPCAFVQPWAAAVIGSTAGVLVIQAIWFIERKAKVDDPVGAISVHGVCGLFGVLCVGIFADGNYGAGWNATGNAIAEPVSSGVTGALYGDWGQLGAQAVGALVICTVMFGIAFAFFKIQDTLTKGGIRSEEADELAGLDLPEMGVPGYPEFMPDDVVDVTGSGKDPEGEREYVTSGAAHAPDPGGNGWPTVPTAPPTST
jgi:ammonium transporter, Amt family